MLGLVSDVTLSVHSVEQLDAVGPERLRGEIFLEGAVTPGRPSEKEGPVLGAPPRRSSLTDLRLLGRVDNAEAVEVRVNEDDEVVVRAVLAFVAGRTEAEQSLDLRLLVIGVEV